REAVRDCDHGRLRDPARAAIPPLDELFELLPLLVAPQLRLLLAPRGCIGGLRRPTRVEHTVLRCAAEGNALDAVGGWRRAACGAFIEENVNRASARRERLRRDGGGGSKNPRFLTHPHHP